MIQVFSLSSPTPALLRTHGRALLEELFDRPRNQASIAYIGPMILSVISQPREQYPIRVLYENCALVEGEKPSERIVRPARLEEAVAIGTLHSDFPPPAQNDFAAWAATLTSAVQRAYEVNKPAGHGAMRVADCIALNAVQTYSLNNGILTRCEGKAHSSANRGL